MRYFKGRNTTAGLFTPACAAQKKVKNVFMPVNIDMNRWSRKIPKVMAGVAKKLMREVLKDKYMKQVTKTPTQKDSNSFRILVCRYFWSCASSEAPTDLTLTGIKKLRWKMLLAVLKTRSVP
ncbi:hypothetical protein GQ600_4947 [Phytophthora cactorum]|nr:hypothetical protein GQ600_4947 [Phytophthora cactorum]